MGKYVLVNTLAKGGMSEIWLARPLGPSGFNRPVVLKRMAAPDESERDYVRMFLDEARIASQLSHPNIVQIIELDFAAGDYFMVLEYLHGETLAHVVRSSKGRGFELPLAAVVFMVAEAAAGIGYAHQRKNSAGQSLGIVHRDVSPQNVLVTYDGQVKVLDFGIAKARGSLTRTQSGVVKGKTGYLAPEQARGYIVDARADVFALGVVLFEAVTATRLHGELDAPLIINRLLTGQPLPLASSRNQAVPPELDALIAKAMSMDSTARFADGQEMSVALRDWLKRQSGSTGAGEVAGLMQRLFADRMAQRRELLDLALPLPRADAAPTVQVPEVTAPAATVNVSRKTINPRAGWVMTAAVLMVASLWAGFFLQRSRQTSPQLVLAKPAPNKPAVKPVLVWPSDEPSVDAGAATVGEGANGDFAQVRRDAGMIPAPVAVARVGKQQQPAPVKALATHGLLSLETEPWTRVYLGKKLLGETPLVEKKLPVGKHTLRLVNEEESVEQSIEVVIKADQVTTKSLKL